MKKLFLAVLAISILSTLTQAQDVPRAEVSTGYSLLFLPKGFTLTLNGGSATASVNMNHWLGVVGDVGVYDGSPGIPGLIGQTYMAGPRFSYRRWGRLIPFGEGLIGGAHANTTNGGFLGARNAFAAGGGAGGDLTLDRAGRFALRGELDALNFHAAGINTGAARVSAGLVFRLGKKEALAK